MQPGSGPDEAIRTVESIVQGNGQVLIQFDFTPLDASQPSDWLMDIKLVNPSGEPNSALTAVSPHTNFTDEPHPWHFEP